jgi:hypothetical protein
LSSGAGSDRDPVPFLYDEREGRSEIFMPSAERPRSIPELSIVALRHPRERDGRTLPAGTVGTVVYAYRDGAGYEVEFSEPFDCVLTVQRDEIQPV